MTNIDERSRRMLYERLEETIGPEGADTLMSMLPPVGWADVATKRDLDGLRLATTHDLDVLATGLREEMGSLSTELRGEMTTLATDLRTEMTTLATDLRTEMTTLATDLRTEMAAMRREIAGVRVELHDGLRDTTRTLFLGMVTCMLTMAGLFLTVLVLLR